MSTALQLMTAAYREGNNKAVAVAPTADEQTETLASLNRIILFLVGHELGEPLVDWPIYPPQRTAPVGAQYPLAQGVNDLPATVWPYPPANVRLMSSAIVATTVYMPENPQDGARMSYVDVSSTAAVTLKGNGRFIQDSFGQYATSVALDDLESPASWFYRADIGTWMFLKALIITDSSPFPDEFDDLLITRLAMRLSPRLGQVPRSDTLYTHNLCLARFKARYKQTPPVLGGASDIPNTMQTRNTATSQWM